MNREKSTGYVIILCYIPMILKHICFQIYETSWRNTYWCKTFFTCLEKYLKAYAQLFALPLNIHWRLIKVLEQTTTSLSHITSSRGYLSYENK